MKLTIHIERCKSQKGFRYAKDKLYSTVDHVDKFDLPILQGLSIFIISSRYLDVDLNVSMTSISSSNRKRSHESLS